MKELALLRFIETHLQQNQKVVLMVVVESNGSSPGRQGFKMAVSEDGTLFQSIGGGVMEVNLVETAKEFLVLTDEEALKKHGHSTVFGEYQVHRKNSEYSSGMICSGKQRVVFVKINPSELNKIRSFSSALTKNRKGIFSISDHGLVIYTPKMTNWAEYFSDEDLSSINGDFFDKFWAVIDGKFLVAYTFNDWGYSEKLGCENKILIIGGGHCALALSELMSKLDFNITVFDDRPNLNTLEKNEFANRVEIIESYEQIGDLIDPDTNTYVVVMTLGYKFDEIVIRQLFHKDFKYFGVLGSKSKMKTLLKTLEKDGFDKQKLAEIRTPIGLPINSHTPEEIAVSIAAEIIAIKNLPEKRT
jgi:xanthine dehydrogenase accessory factor